MRTIIGTDGVTYLHPEDGFLGLPEADAGDPAAARVVVIPFGLEASVSYGGGTSAGPAAILAASAEVELYDPFRGEEAALRWGVATLPEPSIPTDIPAALDQVAALVEQVLAAGRLPLVLGGEHSVTPGAIRPAVARHPDLALLHFDAHADLRDGYDGEHFSHAAAIRRCLDNPGVTCVSVGIRNISAEGDAFRRDNPDRVQVWWSRDRRRWDLDALVAPLQGKTVWITFDLDGFDASLMPATGTPEPGGLMWDDVMDVLEAASRVWKEVVGIDVLELAPVAGLHGPDFLAAKLSYELAKLAMD